MKKYIFPFYLLFQLIVLISIMLGSITGKLYTPDGQSNFWVAIDVGMRLYRADNPTGTHVAVSTGPMLVQVAHEMAPGTFYTEIKDLRDVTIVVFCDSDSRGMNNLIASPVDQAVLKFWDCLAVRFDDVEYLLRVLGGSVANKLWKAFEGAIKEGKYQKFDNWIPQTVPAYADAIATEGMPAFNAWCIEFAFFTWLLFLRKSKQQRLEASYA